MAAQKTPRGERRRQVIASAKKLYARQGFVDTSLEQIAAESEIAPSALKRLFPSQLNLLAAIGAEFFDAFLDEFLQSNYPQAPPPDVLGLFHHLEERFLEAVKSDAVGFLAIMQAAALEDENSLLIGMLDSAADRIAWLVQQGQSAGLFRRPLDPSHAARDIIRMLIGCAIFPLAQPAETEDSLPPPLDTLLHGILKTDV